MRDRSKVNRRTPILTAGLSDPGQARTGTGGQDAVTINATIQYFRAHGADQYVDGYGIHQYPWQATAQQRKTALENNGVAACGNGRPGQPKPCWITEWGFPNADKTCPIDDAARTALVREYMGYFHTLAAAGRLVGTMYFSWDSDPWSKTVDRDSVYRCGALTSAGEAALR